MSVLSKEAFLSGFIRLAETYFQQWTQGNVDAYWTILSPHLEKLGDANAAWEWLVTVACEHERGPRIPTPGMLMRYLEDGPLAELRHRREVEATKRYCDSLTAPIERRALPGGKKTDEPN